MSDPVGDRIVELLTSIDGTLKRLEQRGSPAQRAAASPAHPAAPSSAGVNLDDKYGDPVIKAKDPRDWNGPTMMGRKFSECPPEYLDLLAIRLDYFADKAQTNGETTNRGLPKAPFMRKDAARARGWAARLRGGWGTAGRQAAPRPSSQPSWAELEDGERL